jgi:hypothetical protein
VAPSSLARLLVFPVAGAPLTADDLQVADAPLADDDLQVAEALQVAGGRPVAEAQSGAVIARFRG